MVLFTAVWLTSCRKDLNVETAPVTVTLKSRDTLVQDTYVVSRSGADTSGIILVAPYNRTGTLDSGLLMVMDGAGHLLKQKKTAAAALDFRRWNIGGKIRYTWLVYDVAAYVIPVIAQHTAYAVIADENLEEIKRVSLLASGDITTARKEGIDVHDFILLSEDHYLTMSYYHKTVSNIPDSIITDTGSQVVAPVIQEVQNGAVIWQWDGTQFPELYAASVESNNFADKTTPQDYMHMNAMIIDPRDNNLICSFRNTNQILKISRQTGAILWRLGGKNSDFPLSADQEFLRQHQPTLTDNNQTLLLVDNGHITDRPFTRILEFKLDESAKQVTGFSAYSIPAAFSQYMGSVQKKDNRYFICGGSTGYIMEIDFVTGKQVLALNSWKASYRAYKYD